MKTIIIFLITITTTSVCYGQIIQNVGIKGGMAIANQTWNYKANGINSNKDSRNGLYSAVTLDFIRSKYFNLTTDLGYCAKGSTERIMNTTNDMPEGDGTYTTYDSRFNYLSISPMLKARYETSHFIPYVLLGLRLDYLLSYKSDFNYEQIENDFNETILGINLGAGLEYKIKQFGLFIEGQNQYDFTKVMDTESSVSNSGIEISNNAFVICVGLKYHLMSKVIAK